MPHPPARLLSGRTLRAGRYGFALASFVLALAGRFALDPLLPPSGFPFLTFFPAVLLAALLGGLGPGLLAAALSVAAAKYHFMPVAGSFAFGSAADAIALGFFVTILLVDCAVIHVMTTSLRAVRQERARAGALAGELAQVLEATSDGVFAVGRDWRITFMNRRAAAQLAGGQDLRGRILWDAFPEAAGGPFADAYRRTMATRQPAAADAHYAPFGRHYRAESHPRDDGGVVVFYRDVTDERAAAQELRRSEATLSAVLEALPVGVAIADATGRLLRDNPANRQIWGIPPETPGWQAYGEWVAWWPDTGRRIAADEWAMSRALLKGEVVRGELVECQRFGTGERRLFLNTAAPIRDPDHRIVGGVVAQLDVTEHRQALAESEARLKLFTERAPAAIAMFDGAMRYLALSRRYLRDYGFPEETDPVAIVGTDHYALFPEIPERWREIHRRVLAGETLSANDDPFPRPDGRTDWVRWEMAPWRRADGSIGGALLFSEVVTARVEAERARAESEARLRLALRAGDLGTWRWELEGEALDWDARSKAVFGLPPEAEVTIRRWAEALPEPDRALAEARLARALDPADPDDSYVCDYRARRPDGTVVWVAVVGSAVFEPDPGAPGGRRAVRILGTLRDATAERQAEAARREREARDQTMLALEQRLRELAEPEAMMAAAAQLLGAHLGAVRVEVAETGPAGGLEPRPGWAAPGAPLAEAVTDGLRAGLPLASPGGEGADALLGVPVLRAGRMAAALVVRDAGPRGWTPAEVALAEAVCERLWDSVERARTAAALRASEDRLRLALEAGGMGIWDWDLSTDRLTWDARQFALFGLDPAAGQPGGEVALARIHPDDRDGLMAAIAATLEPDGTSFRHEFRVLRRDGGHRWIGGFGHALRDGRGVAVRMVGLNADITGQREAEAVLARDKAGLERLVEERTAALRESEARLSQAAKMEALGRLAGGVAHDFNNVLQSVQGGVALAIKRLRRDPEAAARFLDLASEATERGAAVTGRLLAFARRSELSAAPVEPADLLDGLGRILRHTLGPAVRLEVEAAPGTPPLLADSSQLEAVLVNLANNARDALPEGCGTIALRAEPAAVAAPGAAGAPAHLPAGAYVRLSVADDGEGMTPEVLARVTEPFFTTKPPGKGTGLGLAMARGFAEQSRGALAIRSAPGLGTTISLWLPRAEDPAAPAATPAAEAEPAGPRAAVLLVDDEDGVRAVIGTALADRGHAVSAAADAAGALARLDAGEPADVLVTDLAMPGGMDGLALVREARRRRPGLPAVLITGHAGEAGRAALGEAAGGGPFAVVRKPAAVEAVEAEITAVLRAAGRWEGAG